MSRVALNKLGHLNVKNTLFLLCDIQEIFRPTMKLFDPMVKNTQKLVGLFQSYIIKMEGQILGLFS